MKPRAREALRGHIVSLAPNANGDATGVAWEVVLIREGLSLNGFYWRRDVLEKAAGLFNGSPVGFYKFGDLDVGNGTVDQVGHLPEEAAGLAGLVGNLVGEYQDVRFQVAADGLGEIRGTLRLFDTAAALGSRLVEFAKAGWLDGGDEARIGLSVNVPIRMTPGPGPAGQVVMYVDEVLGVDSTDIVLHPAAGGHFVRAVAGHMHGGHHAGVTMTFRERIMQALVAVKGREYAARVTEGVADDPATLVALLRANTTAREADAAALLCEQALAACEAGDAEMCAKLVEACAGACKDGSHSAGCASLCEQASAACKAKDMDLCKSLLTACVSLCKSETGGAMPVQGEMGGTLPPAKAPPPARESTTTAASMTTGGTVDVAALVRAEVAAAERAREARMHEAEAAEAAVNVSTLPSWAKDELRARVKTGAFTKAQAEAEIASTTRVITRAIEASPVRGLGDATRHERAIGEGGLTPEEKLQIATDKILGLDPERFLDHRDTEGLFVGSRNAKEARADYRTVRPFAGPKEMFREVTGVRIEDHRASWARDIMAERARQSNPMLERLSRGIVCSTSTRAREAVTVSGNIFQNALANSTARRMLAEYRRPEPLWRQFSTVGAVDHYKAVDHLRYGHFMSLPAVAENGAYVDAFTARTQEAVSFGVTKRGYIVAITEEAIRNDDAGVLRDFAAKLGLAALRTLEQYAADLMLSYTAAINDTNIYDATVLYTAGHANTATTALSDTAIEEARRAMWSQTDPDSLDTIRVYPKKLIVPPALGATARKLATTPKEYGTANNNLSDVYGTFDVVQSPFLRADTTNWYMAADPNEASGLLINFLDGDEEPVVEIQDQSTSDGPFLNDRIIYKVKHVYGGRITDFRTWYGAIVAG